MHWSLGDLGHCELRNDQSPTQAALWQTNRSRLSLGDFKTNSKPDAVFKCLLHDASLYWAFLPRRQSHNKRRTWEQNQNIEKEMVCLKHSDSVCAMKDF